MQLTIRNNNSFQLLLKKAKRQSLLLILLIAGLSMNSFAQPSNDDPCNAIPLLPDAVCNYQIFDNTGATATPTAGVPAPGCANYGGGDVWFQIVVPAASNGNLTFDTQSGGINDLGMAVYRGTCDNLQLIACDDDAGTGLASQIVQTSLTVGSTIWIRVWEYGGDVFGTFGICIKYPGPPPAYDDPCNAVALPAPTTTCNYQTFTDDGATASINVPAPGCATYAGGDVWFSVVVPAGGILTFDTQTGNVLDGGMAIYSGTCDNLTLIACDDNSSVNGNMPQIQANNLTPGSTVWIRFWSKGLINNVGTFGLCVSIPPPPPVNDDPCNATQLTADPTCNFQTFTTVSAFPTAGAPAPGCANYLGGDVWFQVVVPPGGAIVINTQTGIITDGGMAIYRGTCDNLQLIACDDNSSSNGNMPQIIATSLTPGSTIWIRFWEYGNDVPGTFGICVNIPPPAPANDEPCNAIPLTPATNCTYQTFTTESALPSVGAPAPGCANFNGGDVWFTVTVPCDGSLRFDTQTGVITDGGMAIYRGTCDNLQLISCDDDGSANGLMPQITANSLTPGSTIWVRFWEYGNDNPGTFGICVTIPPPPPPTGTCYGAQPFCSSQTYTYPNSTNVPSLGSQGIYGCLFTTPNPAWYYMQLQTGGSLDIFIQQSSTTGTPLDVDFCLWGPFPTLASSCNAISASNIVDCSYSAAATETANIINGQAGEFYILLITNYSNQPGSVTFNQSGGTGSTSCDILCTLTSANSGPVCPGATVDLTSTLVVGATYQWTGPNCFNQLPGSTTQNPTGVVVPTIPGMYIYTVTATTPSGTSCFSYDTVFVIPPPVVGNDTTVYICSGSTKNLETVYDTTGLITSWSHFPGGETVGNPAAADTSGIYQLVVTNIAGCNDTTLVTLVVDTVRFTVTSTGNATCILPGSLTVTGESGIGSIFDYSLDGVTFQASNIFTVIPGTYIVITRDSLGCTSASAPVTVDFTNDLQLSIRPDTVVCVNQSVTLTAITNVVANTYSWTPTAGLSAPTSATTIASPTDTTLYTVQVTYGTCTASASTTIFVDKDLRVDAGGPLDITGGGNAQIQAVVTGSNPNLSSILWTPGTGLSSTTILDPVITPVIANGTATYDITVTNTNGCTATDQLIVNVLTITTVGCINTRNAFTPNGDGINDLWYVYDNYGCLTNVTVTVFNRYGSKVFESSDYHNTWDGHYSGKQLPDGTYYAILEYKLVTGKKITVKTDLTILR